MGHEDVFSHLIFSCFNISGIIPWTREWLNTSVKASPIWFAANFKHLLGMPILGFHVTSEKTKIKLKLKILSFYLYGVKGIFKRISAGLSSAR